MGRDGAVLLVRSLGPQGLNGCRGRTGWFCGPLWWTGLADTVCGGREVGDSSGFGTGGSGEVAGTQTEIVMKERGVLGRRGGMAAGAGDGPGVFFPGPGRGRGRFPVMVQVQLPAMRPKRWVALSWASAGCGIDVSGELTPRAGK